MKKSDLVAGKHFVKERNGDIYLYLNNRFIGIKNKEYGGEDFNWYDENLFSKHFESDDIISVGVSPSNMEMNLIINEKEINLIEWIWKREETKEMTVAEIEEALGHKVKVVK